MSWVLWTLSNTKPRSGRGSFNQVTQEVSERHLGKKRIYATLFAQVYSDKALELGDPRQSRNPAMYDLGILKAVTQNNP